MQIRRLNILHLSFWARVQATILRVKTTGKKTLEKNWFAKVSFAINDEFARINRFARYFPYNEMYNHYGKYKCILFQKKSIWFQRLKFLVSIGYFFISAYLLMFERHKQGVIQKSIGKDSKSNCTTWSWMFYNKSSYFKELEIPWICSSHVTRSNQK